jgi:hypothetical protein
MKTTKMISALVMVSTLALGSAAHAGDPAPTRGQVLANAQSAKAVVAGPVAIHAYSAYSGGTIYATLAVTGTDADCKGQPIGGTSTAVGADSIVEFRVGAGQIACLSAGADRGIELLWHAQKGAPTAASVMMARR